MHVTAKCPLARACVVVTRGGGFVPRYSTKYTRPNNGQLVKHTATEKKSVALTALKLRSKST